MQQKQQQKTPKKKGRPEKKIYTQSEMMTILESYINDEEREIYWLDENEYAKAKFQFTSSLSAACIENGLNLYGHKDECVNVIEIAWRLAEDFGLRVRGLDQPISLEVIKQNRKFIIVDKIEKENEEDKKEDTIGLVCPECKKDNKIVKIIFSEGCFHCPECGYSKC